MYPSYQEVVGVDGEAIEFEWNIFPGFSSLQILQEIQNSLRNRNIQPKEFKDQIIFISMFNDIDWPKGKNDDECRESQGSRDEILARTLDVSGSWVERKVL